MADRKFRQILGLIYIMLFISLAPAQKTQPEKELFTINDYFSVNSMSIADVSRDGRWLAGTLSTRADRLPRDNFRYGDPSYIAPFRNELVIIDTESGEKIHPFKGKRQVRNLKWSPEGQLLALFVYEKENYSLKIWNRQTGKFTTVKTPKDEQIAANSHLIWSEDGKFIHFVLRARGWDKKCTAMFHYLNKGPIIVHDSEKNFLQWDRLRRMNRLQVPAIWDRGRNRTIKLMEETPILSYRVTADSSHIIFEEDVTPRTDYQSIGGTTKQLHVFSLLQSSKETIMEGYKNRRFTWRKDNEQFAYTEKGDIHIMTIGAKKALNLTKKKEEKPGDEKKEKPRYGLIRFSPDGKQLLCTKTLAEKSGNKDTRSAPRPRQYWLIDISDKAERMVYELNQKMDSRPSLRLVDWSPDGGQIYFSYSAPDRYDRGLVRLELASGTLHDMIRSERQFRSFRMSENGQSFIFTESDGDFPADWFQADKDFNNKKRLSDLNPQLRDKAISHTELISYLDADGKKLYGVLYYPANYKKGTCYPLITEVYERYFNNGFNSTLNIFTSAGYAVLHPSVNLQTGYPGEAWAKGALAAVNKVIEMGVADPEMLGIQGTSYGGYATVLLITQTNRFKAAINNSGKVNMVSFYTQSPRLGVRNIHAPENSQDRIGGTLWQFPERYLSHSAILQADRINTPLLCITGDQDPNVEAIQSQEIYYALRRLGKKVVWLRYHNGAHGGPNTSDERKDMYQRMINWYDKYLKGVSEDKD